jgi:hypothetical protein
MFRTMFFLPQINFFLITNLGFFGGNYCFSSVHLTKFSICFEKNLKFLISQNWKKILGF